MREQKTVRFVPVEKRVAFLLSLRAETACSLLAWQSFSFSDYSASA